MLNWLYADPKRAAAVASIFSFGEFVLPIQYGAEDFPADTDPRISRFFTEFGEVTGEGNYGYTSWTFWPAEAETQLWTDIELVWSGEDDRPKSISPSSRRCGTRPAPKAASRRFRSGKRRLNHDS